MSRRRNTTKRRKFKLADWIIILAAVVVAAVFLGNKTWSGENSGKSAEELLSGVPTTELTSALLELPSPSGNYPTYNRDEFGQRWADVDGNGCDTRNDILNRDLSSVTYKENTNNCVVLTGVLDDPYTGKKIDFVRGQNTSDAVQIDHVVALANAWKSGAWEWDALQREQFANDPLNLLAVDGPTNGAKSASSADEWLPPSVDYQCSYAARQIAVKYEWNLSVTDNERDALAQVIVNCPSQKLIENNDVYN